MTAQPQKVMVLWNGGWDIYLVDPGQVCDTPAEKFEGNERYFPVWHEGAHSGTPCWLKCQFVEKHNFGQAHQSVRVIRRMAGGD